LKLQLAGTGLERATFGLCFENHIRYSPEWVEISSIKYSKVLRKKQNLTSNTARMRIAAASIFRQHRIPEE